MTNVQREYFVPARKPSDFVKLIAQAWKTDAQTFGPAFEMALLFAHHLPEACTRLSAALEAESNCPEADAEAIAKFSRAFEVWTHGVSHFACVVADSDAFNYDLEVADRTLTGESLHGGRS